MDVMVVVARVEVVLVVAERVEGASVAAVRAEVVRARVGLEAEVMVSEATAEVVMGVV